MSKKLIIPIVFATDDGYAPYLGVALHSLIVHTSPVNEYRIFIFCTHLSQEHKRRIRSLAKDHVKVEFLNVSEKTQNLQSYNDTTHLSVETTYRLLIPDILPEYDKVLYLDCDIAVLADVAELYQFDIKNKVLGVGQLSGEVEWIVNSSKNLQVEVSDVFNAGILLINTKSFFEQGIKEQCLALLGEDWKRKTPRFLFQDQDALTVVCQGKVERFPEEWNFEWHKKLPYMKENGTLSDTEADDLYFKIRKNINILHFASSYKPWSTPEAQFADVFWEYARETVFYEEILVKETKPKKIPKSRAFPWKLVSIGSDIVIYGGGLVGKSYITQMQAMPICNLVAICDQNPKNIQNAHVPVIAKEGLSGVEFDYIVIAIENKKIVGLVREDLMKIGILPEKII